MNERASVAVPVADLYSEPVQEEGLRVTQVLYGESLLVMDQRGDFLFVEAEEQPRFKEGRWGGYEGWIRAAYVMTHAVDLPLGLVEETTLVTTEEGEPLVTLPMGAKVAIVEEHGVFLTVRLLIGQHGLLRRHSVRSPTTRQDRQAVLEMAKRFLGVPYLWGGRSIPVRDWTEVRMGLDCSGFVNLLFRLCGFIVPRDAKDQYLFSKKIPLNSIRPADLIFLWDEKSEKVNHVMLYLGEDVAIEARGEGRKVEIVTLRERLGSSVHGLDRIEVVLQGKKVCAGSLIKDEG